MSNYNSIYYKNYNNNNNNPNNNRWYWNYTINNNWYWYNIYSTTNYNRYCLKPFN